MTKTIVRRLLPGTLLAAGMLACVAACGGVGASSGGLPGDKQVISDVMPVNKDGLLDVSVTENRRGEAYFHQNDLNWYWDRGVVIKRRAALEGAPDAVIVVGGLARYVLVGDEYKYHRFLTTYNEYEGIPMPDEDELAKFVARNLDKVFVGRDHTITEVSSVEMVDDANWTWHSAASFSVPFAIAYKYKNSYTTVESRRDVFDIRFYRDSSDSDISDLLATEKARQQLGTEQFTAERLDSMKTLRDGL